MGPSPERPETSMPKKSALGRAPLGNTPQLPRTKCDADLKARKTSADTNRTPQDKRLTTEERNRIDGRTHPGKQDRMQQSRLRSSSSSVRRILLGTDRADSNLGVEDDSRERGVMKGQDGEFSLDHASPAKRHVHAISGRNQKPLLASLKDRLGMSYSSTGAARGAERGVLDSSPDNGVPSHSRRLIGAGTVAGNGKTSNIYQVPPLTRDMEMTGTRVSPDKAGARSTSCKELSPSKKVEDPNALKRSRSLNAMLPSKRGLLGLLEVLGGSNSDKKEEGQGQAGQREGPSRVCMHERVEKDGPEPEDSRAEKDGPEQEDSRAAQRDDVVDGKGGGASSEAGVSAKKEDQAAEFSCRGGGSQHDGQGKESGEGRIKQAETCGRGSDRRGSDRNDSKGECLSNSGVGGDIETATTAFDQGGSKGRSRDEGEVERLRQQVDYLQTKLKEAEASRMARGEALAAAEADAAQWAERACRAEEQLSRSNMDRPSKCPSGSITFTRCSSDSSQLGAPNCPSYASSHMAPNSKNASREGSPRLRPRFSSVTWEGHLVSVDGGSSAPFGSDQDKATSISSSLSRALDGNEKDFFCMPGASAPTGCPTCGHVPTLGVSLPPASATPETTSGCPSTPYGAESFKFADVVGAWKGNLVDVSPSKLKKRLKQERSFQRRHSELSATELKKALRQLDGAASPLPSPPPGQVAPFLINTTTPTHSLASSSATSPCKSPTKSAGGANGLLARSRGASKWGRFRELWSTFQEFSEFSPAGGGMSACDLPKAFQRLGYPLPPHRLEALLKSLGLGVDTKFDFLLFGRTVSLSLLSSQRERWVRSLECAEAVSDALEAVLPLKEMEGCSREQGLSELAKRLDNRAIERVCASVSTALAEGMREFREEISRKEGVHEGGVHGGGGGNVSNAGGGNNSKFALSRGGFEANFGDLSKFFDGLDGLIGLPSPRVLDAMQAEHTLCEDSLDTFVTTNYDGTITCPSTEWQFVFAPDLDRKYPGMGLPPMGREPCPIKAFIDHPSTKEAGLTFEEVLALRLYTGPMFVKYNASLRGFPSMSWKALKGNRYATTLHAITSGIVKLAKVWKLPENRRVYRGLAGLLLPKQFWDADQFGCRGGVEFGFLSTTTKREVAVQYISNTNKSQDLRSTVFEIELGQVDRGASVSFLSQYPCEDEILIPPLSNMEVYGEPRLELMGGEEIMVIPLRVSVNQKSLTIDQLMSRRRTLHLAMAETLRKETQAELSDITRQDEAERRAKGGIVVPSSGVDDMSRDATAILEEFDSLIKAQSELGDGWYNHDEHYKQAIVDAVMRKRLSILKYDLIKDQRDKARSLTIMSGVGSPWGASQIRECLDKVRQTPVHHLANPGVVYSLRSGYDKFPWGEIMDRKLSSVELPLDMMPFQAEMAWEVMLQSGIIQQVSICGVVISRPFEATIDLHAKRPPLGPFGSQVLAPLLEVHPCLTRINLAANDVQDEGLKHLMVSMARREMARGPSLRGITRVELQSNAITNRSSKVLAAAISSQAKSLEVLLLGDNRIGDEGIGLVSPAVRGCEQLKQLDLGSNQITEEGAVALAGCLPFFTCLEHLNLSGNPLGRRGVAIIAKAISSLPSLKTFHVKDAFEYKSEVVKMVRALSPAGCCVFGIGEGNLFIDELEAHTRERVAKKRQEDQEHWDGIRDVPSDMHGDFTRTESDPKPAVSAMSPEQKIGLFRRHASEKSMLPGQASSAARKGSPLL